MLDKETEKKQKLWIKSTTAKKKQWGVKIYKNQNVCVCFCLATSEGLTGSVLFPSLMLIILLFESNVNTEKTKASCSFVFARYQLNAEHHPHTHTHTLPIV